MIFDPAFKRVQCLFRPQHLFPIVHLSRIEWQVLILVFTSLIAWLEPLCLYHNASYSWDDIFTNFTKKVAFRENIIMNSYARVALLQCYILAS